MKKTLSMLAVTAAMSLPVAAFAIDLSAARAAGAVCEQADGYVRAVKPSADVNALVTEVNSRRKAEYTRISKENNQTLAVVGQLANGQILAGGGAKSCQ